MPIRPCIEPLRRPARCAAIALIVAALVLAAATHAQSEWTLDQLMAALGRREQAQASFTETKYLQLLSRPLTVHGTLSYVAPDRLEKRMLEPNQEILLVEGDRLTVEIPGRRIRRSYTLQEHAALWGFVESLRATLRGDRAALERFYQLDLHGEVRHWLLTLQPREAKMRAVIAEIRIAGAGGRIASVEVREAGGDRSVMQLQESRP
jgi:outer membrane lipoprotein-sorting protein